MELIKDDDEDRKARLQEFFDAIRKADREDFINDMQRRLKAIQDREKATPPPPDHQNS